MSPNMVPMRAAVPEPTSSPIPPPIVVLPKPQKPSRLMLKHDGASDLIKKWWKTIHEDWKEVIDWCNFTPGSDLEKTAYFMMMGFITQDTRHIQMVMPNQSRKWLQDRRERARKYGIWCGNGTLHAEWFDLTEQHDDFAGISFMVNVMIINGDIEVVKQYDHRTGKHRLAYRLSKNGLESAKWLFDLPRPTSRELNQYSDDGNPHG